LPPLLPPQIAQSSGSSLIDQLSSNPAVGIIGPPDTHISTGLARPEVFNWPAYLQNIVTADQPNAVVLTFGANDDQTLTGEGGGESFGSPAWQAEYRRRIGGLMDVVTGSASHRRLFFVGIPPVRDAARFANDYVLINNLINSEAQARPGRVYYVDTVAALAGRRHYADDFAEIHADRDGHGNSGSDLARHQNRVPHTDGEPQLVADQGQHVRSVHQFSPYPVGCILCDAVLQSPVAASQ